MACDIFCPLSLVAADADLSYVWLLFGATSVNLYLSFHCWKVIEMYTKPRHIN